MLSWRSCDCMLLLVLWLKTPLPIWLLLWTMLLLPKGMHCLHGALRGMWRECLPWQLRAPAVHWDRRIDPALSGWTRLRGAQRLRPRQSLSHRAWEGRA